MELWKELKQINNEIYEIRDLIEEYTKNLLVLQSYDKETKNEEIENILAFLKSYKKLLEIKRTRIMKKDDRYGTLERVDND